MANQIVISSGAKVRNLNGVLTGTTGVVNSLGINVANGIPQLDGSGKILVSQLPNSVMEYKGTWNAATNTPTLVNGTGNQGDVYLCNVAGTVNFGAGAITFAVGDQAIYSGTIWQKAGGSTGTVTSVAVTETGDALTITGSPITTSGTINIGFAGISSQYVNGAGGLTTFPTLISSIGLSMPSAFTVTNSPLTANGTIAVTGAGVASQYVRGDGTLANFPTSGGGGGSVSYYLNGSVNQGTFVGNTYYEMSKVPVIGAGTDFTINADGYISQFITDAGDPALLEIPAGNWNFEMYFSASSGGGTPSFYVELYKYNGSTFTLIASSSATPEGITNGTAIDLYTTALAVPTTALTLTDRLAVRVFVNHSGRTITLHTENSHLCQVITTFSTGITALNGLTAQVQYFGTGTSGTDFNISSTTATHTFNLPIASATNTGKLSSSDWSVFNSKEPAITAGTTLQYYRGDKTFQTLNTTAVVEATNLYFTDARSRSALSFAAGSGAYNSSTGVITIPTNNNQITNGSNFITLGSLSGGTGISYNNTTGVITNSAPDQTVSLSNGAGISVTGTYPSFTIASTITQYTDALARAAISGGTGINYNSTTGVITNTITQYTDALARAAISLTTTGTSGAATYNSTTGVLNIPQYIGGVTSVFGRTGAVVATSGDYTTTQVTEGTNLYFTEARVDANSNVAANTAARHNAVTLGTANGLSLSTQVLSLALSSTSTTGALSSTDWNTFNGKQGALTLTTTGTSGAATLVGDTLNIPQYGGGGGGMAIGGSITSATQGSVLFAGASGVLAQDNANFFWDDTNNRLGIGTASPTTRLNVSGSTTAVSGLAISTSINPTLVASANGNTLIGLDINPTFTNGAFTGVINSYLRLGSAGRFGINGVNTFVIQSLLQFADFYGKPDNTGGFAFYGGGLYNTGSGITVWGNNSGSSASTISFLRNGFLENARFDSSGNFAINTSTIGSKFQVNGNAAIGYSASTAAPTNGLAVNGNVLIGTTTDAGYKLDVSGTGRFSDQLIVKTNDSAQGISIWGRSDDFAVLRFKTSDGATRKATIYTNPSDLIFETAGTTRLTIASTGAATFSSSVFSTTFFVPANEGIAFNGVGSFKTAIYSRNSGADLCFNAGDSEKMRITSGGNVLIGTTTDSGYKLDVNGTVRSTGGFFDTSDSRLKTLITNNHKAKGIENVTAKLYVKNGKEELGYYAQDLQEILPSAVIEGEDGFLSLSYTQVHTAKIAHLEKEIAELKELIKTLL